jgi:cytochrome c peroxidase
MSDDGYMSCTSCHYGGFHDGRVWDFSNRGEGLRNTKSLLGIAGTKHGRVHWSANMDEIQDFERDIRESLGGNGFMTDEQWALHREDTFGVSSAGVSSELDALAAYFESLDKVGRSPYRNPDGSFTEQALEGKKIFERSLCPVCHSGSEFTDGQLHDVGTLLPTSGERLSGPLTGIDTPTLKGVWQTAPYLHDGRAATLHEIFTKHNPNDRIGMTSNLTPLELDQLVAYLHQLDDEPEPEPSVAEPPPNCACKLAAPSERSGADYALLLGIGALALLRRRKPPGKRASFGAALRKTRSPRSAARGTRVGAKKREKF